MKDNGVSKRMLLIGSLKNIRLSLNVKRIVSPKISRNDLKNLIEEEKAGNTVLSSMIDDVFNDYFKPLRNEEPSDKSIMSLNDMQKMVDAGISLVKRDNHFKTNSENGKDAA